MILLWFHFLLYGKRVPSKLFFKLFTNQLFYIQLYILVEFSTAFWVNCSFKCSLGCKITDLAHLSNISLKYGRQLRGALCRGACLCVRCDRECQRADSVLLLGKVEIHSEQDLRSKRCWQERKASWGREVKWAVITLSASCQHQCLLYRQLAHPQVCGCYRTCRHSLTASFLLLLTDANVRRLLSHWQMSGTVRTHPRSAPPRHFC